MPKLSITAEDTLMLKGISDNLGFSENRFNSLCNTYQMLNEEQRVLFWDLLKRFLFIPLSKYQEELAIATKKMLDSVNQKNILIYNGLSTKEMGKIKSNYLISYQFKASNLRSIVSLWPRNLQVVNNIKELLCIQSFDDTTLVLVDDFVGSGETIEKAFYDISIRLKVYGKVIRKFVVLCIVAMHQAIERLSRSGIQVYCTHEISRGISDFYSGKDLTNATRIMTEIERKLNVSDNFKFGYRQSEALVSMERCPNNTFALFRTGKNAIFRR
ncbi:MAG: hypothetical protein NC453_19175 [Muribaculum sp.]|nr:hypothetical protein [Muribaculum sp.]